MTGSVTGFVRRFSCVILLITVVSVCAVACQSSRQRQTASAPQQTSAQASTTSTPATTTGPASTSTTAVAPVQGQATASQATPTARQTSAPSATIGSTQAAPANIRNFSPKETQIASPIAADKLDLRKVFDDLGPDATMWYQHVWTLANPFFGGREPGTRGDELAVEYIEFYFRQYGLEPAFPGEGISMGGESATAYTSYRQSFDFASPNPDVKLISAAGSMNGQPLEEGKDFVVLGNSGNGSVTAPLTFVGYAIAAGNDGYTSFEENTDLTGRVALLMRYEPLNAEGKSRWSTARFSQHSGIAAKMRAVADRGAAAIVLVNPPGAVDGKTALEPLAESARFGRRMSVPVIQVTPETVDRMLAVGDSQKRDLLAWRTLADNGEIKCTNLDDSLQLSINTNLEVNDRIKTMNIAGVLPGKGSLADEWIVIGGHYDHVGYGYTGTSPDNVGQLHPGADDNASGTGAMLIAAKRFSEKYRAAGEGANLRSIMFMGFGGEEAGLHGSKYFVENPPMSLGAVNVMFNMDMVGRLRDDQLLIQGTGSAEQFEQDLTPIFEKSGLKVAQSPTGRGPSDHSNFYGKQVPVLFLFTGEHADYHKPADVAHTVNPAGAVKVINLLEMLADHYTTNPERLRFKEATGGGTPRDTGARVSFGTMPDYTAELETGIKVESVRDGSSAAEAGVQPGDILLTWNGEELTGPARLAALLGQHNPGDRVTVILRRGDSEVTINVHLKARAAQ